MIKMDGWHCKRCGHDWTPRKEGRPIRCGKCKSPYWDQERQGVEPSELVEEQA